MAPGGRVVALAVTVVMPVSADPVVVAMVIAVAIAIAAVVPARVVVGAAPGSPSKSTGPGVSLSGHSPYQVSPADALSGT